MKFGQIFPALVVLSVLALASPARATFIIDIAPNGANVDVTGSGSIDTTDLTLDGSASEGPSLIQPLDAELLFGTSHSETAWTFTGGPTTVGSGGVTDASSSNGDDFVFFAASGLDFILLSSSYVSDTALSTTMTFDNASLASLGLTPGTYNWDWGTGPHADSLQINVETAAAAVPEPGSFGLLATALTGLLLILRRRSNGETLIQIDSTVSS